MTKEQRTCQSERVKRSYLKYLAALLLFGSNGIVASAISLDSSMIVLTRTIIGSLFLIVVFLLSRQKMVFWKAGKQSVYLLMSGVAMAGNWLFLFEAYQQIGVSLAILACYCGPVIVMMVAPVLFKERFTLGKLFGFVAVIAGMLCVYGAGISEIGLSWGLLCGLMSAVMYALMVICNKKAPGIVGLENAMIQLVSCGIIVALFVLFTHAGDVSIPVDDIVPILFLGVVNTGLGCYLYFSSIKLLSAQTISISGYVEPLSALIMSALVLGERLGVIGQKVCLGASQPNTDTGSNDATHSRLFRHPIQPALSY